ncbi:hypothetical protein JTE90_015065 [Oedothorax gibbosus]|uniref:Integrase catalytic domain-containing protein n=1 Tax=Oedothorax gibbosus TaxID=931172 RepID=A0AAV6VRR4_9ARAC|nr:hypothetical protein JTE90_015065 [Oedothorax gibbosus]
MQPATSIKQLPQFSRKASNVLENLLNLPREELRQTYEIFRQAVQHVLPEASTPQKKRRRRPQPSIIIGASVWDYGADSACDAPLYFEVVSSGCTSIQRRAGEGRVIVLDFAVEKNGYASTREVPSEGHASVLEFAFESSGCTSIQRRAGEGRVIVLDFAVEKNGYASTREVPSEGHASVLEFAFKSSGCTSIQRRAGEGHTRVLDFAVEPSGYASTSEVSEGHASCPGIRLQIKRVHQHPEKSRGGTHPCPAGAPGTHSSCIERTRLRLWAPLSTPAGEPAPQQHFTEGCASVTGLSASAEKRRKESESRENVNFLSHSTGNPFLNPYLSKGYVNGREITVLRDTGSTIDVVCRKYVLPDSYTGEIVWVKQPLDVNPIALPLAVVELNGEFGPVQTKAAVCADYLDEGRYVLGNRTAVLIEGSNGYEFNYKEQKDATTVVESGEESIGIPEVAPKLPEMPIINVFSHIGFPRELQVDQGTFLTSVWISELIDRLGIKVKHSSVYHLQSNPLKPFHQSLKKLLCALCLEADHDREKHFLWPIMALLTVTHESTGLPPAELVFGQNLLIPEPLIYEMWLEPEEDSKLVTENGFEQINRLTRCQDLVIAKLTDSQAKNKTRNDKNTVKREFGEGELQWMGPGVIRRKLSNTNDVVERIDKTDHRYQFNKYPKRPTPSHRNRFEMNERQNSNRQKIRKSRWDQSSNSRFKQQMTNRSDGNTSLDLVGSGSPEEHFESHLSAPTYSNRNFHNERRNPNNNCWNCRRNFRRRNKKQDAYKSCASPLTRDASQNIHPTCNKRRTQRSLNYFNARYGRKFANFKSEEPKIQPCNLTIQPFDLSKHKFNPENYLSVSGNFGRRRRKMNRNHQCNNLFAVFADTDCRKKYFEGHQQDLTPFETYFQRCCQIRGNLITAFNT